MKQPNSYADNGVTEDGKMGENHQAAGADSHPIQVILLNPEQDL